MLPVYARQFNMSRRFVESHYIREKRISNLLRNGNKFTYIRADMNVQSSLTQGTVTPLVFIGIFLDH